MTNSEIDNDEAGPSQPRRTPRGSHVSESSRVYEEVCIFCNKKSKYLKGKDQEKPL